MLLPLMLAGAEPAATSPPPAPACASGQCEVQLSAEAMLSLADRLVFAKRFAEAAPYLEALKKVPQLVVERQFLEGYVAVETGDLPKAEARFRAVLAQRPDMTRARLELARVLLLRGKDRDADYHFRLAADEKSLPADIKRTVYAARSIIRDRDRVSLNVGFGLAPDTNINSATNDRTVDVQFGDVALPFELSSDARQNTGIGQTLSVSAGARMSVAPKVAVTSRIDAYGVNYSGRFADDVSVVMSAGPEISPSPRDRISLEGLVGQRWYGGHLLTRQFGTRLSADKVLAHGGSLGIEAEIRHSSSPINAGYGGWTYSVRIAHERVISKTGFASVYAWGRRDAFRSGIYANREIGMGAGIGAELPKGFNVGGSASVARVAYDDPIVIFGPDARRDWRLSTRLFVALRSIRLAGFSPSVAYTYTRNASNLELYRFDRHRLEFQMARLF